MDNKRFLFNPDWAEILKGRKPQIRLEVYDAIIEYAASGTLPELKAESDMAFQFIKKEIDWNRTQYEEKAEARREAGRKGGLAKAAKLSKSSKSSKAKQNVAKVAKLSIYDNDNDNVNDINKELSYESQKEAHTRSPLSILQQYMNDHADGTAYEPKNPNYWRFLAWIRESAPYVASHLMPLTEAQFESLKARYGADPLGDMILRIENRKDLRSRYTNLYRTLNSWFKRDGDTN